MLVRMNDQTNQWMNKVSASLILYPRVFLLHFCHLLMANFWYRIKKENNMKNEWWNETTRKTMKNFSDECKRKYFSHSHSDLWFTLACAPHLTCKKSLSFFFSLFLYVLKRNAFKNTQSHTHTLQARSDFPTFPVHCFELSALSTEQKSN